MANKNLTKQSANNIGFSAFDLMFIQHKVWRSVAIVAISTIIVLLAMLLFFTETSRDNSVDLTGPNSYELTVKDSVTSSGYRSETKILTYLVPPRGVNCESVVVQRPAASYTGDSEIPKAGDVMKVYIAPDAECTSNGKFISGEAEKLDGEIIYQNSLYVFLFAISVMLIITVLVGVLYSHSDSFRNHYLSHKYISSILIIMWGSVFVFYLAFYLIGFKAVSIWGILGVIILVALVKLVYRYIKPIR